MIPWLVGLSVLFTAAERVWPFKGRRFLRSGWAQDLFYLVFNSQFLGVFVGWSLSHLTRHLDPVFARGWAGGLPLAWQIPLLIVTWDFLQWLIHNLLHRVPWLWEFHKVHHSITELDWIGNWRYHAMEVLVYTGLLYVPSALMGFSGTAFLVQGVVSVAAGHFAHSNTRIRMGAFNFVLNTPEMHRWHHTHPDAGPENKNFGIALSVWDWLFGTAYNPPGKAPARLGFTGIERYPMGILGSFVEPFRRASGK